MTQEKLLYLIGKKKSYFQLFLDLCLEESTTIQSHKESLEQKQILLTCIEEIDQQLSQFKDTCLAISESIQIELDELKKMIEMILDIEQMNHHQQKKSLKIDGFYDR